MLKSKTLVVAAALLFNFFASGQAQTQAVGETAWGGDGWAYQWNGNTWVITQWSRAFPDPNNIYMYDVFENSSLYARIDLSFEPGWVHEYSYVFQTQLKYPVGTTDPYAKYIF